ncbi:hypothetical protein DFH09DRAFT_462216 [Mycena vulgaris]|nr:hypothetical protein DFH09DRAFT_462216 [Mycena vulgaris]
MYGRMPSISSSSIPTMLRLVQMWKAIHARICQVLGAIMKEADGLVSPCYGFIEIGSLTKPTPKKIEETRAANHDLMETLAGTFMYNDPKDTSDIAIICHHPIFQKLLNTTFFAAKGINRRIYYFAGMQMLPVVTFGLLIDSVLCGIAWWKPGSIDRSILISAHP